MKCGVSQVNITPPAGVELSGYVLRQQPSIGIHDDLYVRGLYLEQGDARLLWLHADLIGFQLGGARIALYRQRQVAG